MTEDLLELHDRAVGRSDLVGHPDRAQLLAATAGGVAVQPVLLEDVDALATRTLDRAAHQVARTLVDPGPAPAPHRGGAVPEDRGDLDRALEGQGPHGS